MAKTSDMIQSKFLRKEDFPEDEVCTITGCSLEEINAQSAESKWVLTFKEHDKGLVLNTTTIRVLEGAFGDESDGWIGKRVKVYVDPNVTFQGRVIGGLRLMPPRTTKVAPAPVAAASEDWNDEIPF